MRGWQMTIRLTPHECDAGTLQSALFVPRQARIDISSSVLMLSRSLFFVVVFINTESEEKEQTYIEPQWFLQ